MQRIPRTLVLSIAFFMAFLTGMALSDHHDAGSHAMAEKSADGEMGEHSDSVGLHGGKLSITDHHQFETLFAKDGIRVFIYSAQQAPMMIQKSTGTATLIYKNKTKEVIPLLQQKPADDETSIYFCPMHPDVVQMEPGQCKLCGGMTLFIQDYLFARADLSTIEPGSVNVEIQLKDLKGIESEVTY
ncbi:MAG: hypothetical protein KJ970_14265 [Candidatus Eisenbacteria bacterium]|uniref:Heavy metal binding domain-containing protein n=1 Tax=Eiseniibacteriota bacterium TaxID=2212470 RepID=A0A948W7W6_UNCEI|nr:hypothetical protein [Candidatus Eisenbacteria bacterium]MBU1947400.1 hypothetical protein [Candidatus Eisenbacteria bacterium]MBU2692081.1 hypothetical protein [Candidatus Eisenbacteria bacterium]